MRTLTALSAVLFSLDGPIYFTALQLVAVIFFAVALFIHQTKEVKQ
jgi:hypothetical protein